MRRARASLVSALALLAACAYAVHAGKPNEVAKEDRMLEEGLALLQKKDAASICEGAAKLGRLGRPEAIDPLLALLKSRDEGARECVREALAKLDVAPVLLERWRSADAESKDRALEQASALPHPGLMTLYGEAAADADADRRKRVAIGLKRQVESPSIIALLETLVRDPDRDVRWWAIDTLGLSKTPEAARVLRERLATEADADLRKFIARALGQPE